MSFVVVRSAGKKIALAECTAVCVSVLDERVACAKVKSDWRLRQIPAATRNAAKAWTRSPCSAAHVRPDVVLDPGCDSNTSPDQCSEERCLAKILDEQLCIDRECYNPFSHKHSLRGSESLTKISTPSDFKALYIAKGRGEVNPRALKVGPLPSHTLGSFSHIQHTEEDWRRSGSSGLPVNIGAGKPQQDRRATVCAQVESDYEDDAKQSVTSRLSHTDEDRDQW